MRHASGFSTRPSAHRPVVVLSNNDGCVIARSNEAKALGFKMGDPFFKVRPLIERHGVAVFSSNYTLYGDMSSRVMQTLEQFAPEVEIYSIDEAFLNLAGFAAGPARRPCRRHPPHGQAMDRHSGSVGIGPTKTLAKAANQLAKKRPSRRRRLDHHHAAGASGEPFPASRGRCVGHRQAMGQIP